MFATITVVLAILKLTGLLAISWWVVLAPLALSAVFYLAAFAFVVWRDRR